MKYKVGDLVMVPIFSGRKKHPKVTYSNPQVQEAVQKVGMVIAGPDSTKELDDGGLYMDLYPDGYLIQVGDDIIEATASMLMPAYKEGGSS